ncbi:caspase family protein [Emticicia sp. C21]|uniref:caspase family protein n=1 Tax=Emticicia sp. C21 TaxID=2302915 RepID=UPI000E3423A5|nr:caspase family protein [Emticicia sp. C21]RFS15579.1 hypothetical protein D0T08_15645 [Emticicia sp. C21]
MRPILSKIYLPVFLLLSHGLFAQNLHFLSVINTDDYTRQDRRMDADNVNKMAGNIAQYMNLTKYTYNFSDSVDYNPTSVKLTLQSLNIAPCGDDIVWFHYSGLGGNYGESMPTLQLFGGELEVKEIENTLRQKRPKLLLISIDCSNKPVRSKWIANQTDVGGSRSATIKKSPSAIKPRVTITPSNEIPYFQIIENYNKLFKDFKGTKIVLLLSTLKDEDALSDSRKGSLWVQALNKAFSEITNNNTQKDIWDKDLHVKLQSYLSRLSKATQHSRIFTYLNSHCDDE